MSQGIILHSIADAEHCVRNRLHQEGFLFSTHSAVDIYLREFYSIKCQCLSSFLEISEINCYNKISSERVDHILRLLDEKVAPSINEKLDLIMNYFVPLYSYSGKFHYSAYMLFLSSIEKIIEKYNLTNLMIYNQKFNNLLELNYGIATVASSLLNSNIKTTIINNDTNNYNYIVERLHKIKSFMENIIEDPARSIRKIIKMNQKPFDVKLINGKKSIVIIGNLYNLNFIIERLHNHNLIHYRHDSDLSSIVDDNLDALKQQHENIIINNLDGIDFEGTAVDKIFIQDVRQDFLKKFSGYTNSITLLKAVNQKSPISLGIWGCPPNFRHWALLTEYLQSMGIPVLGAQHGGTYGDAFNPWQFDSDFSRCNYYISYGFTKDDLKSLYPDKETPINILPLGYIEPKHSKKAKKDIDILFPITNSISIFEGGMTRMPPDKLTERQIKLLEYLNSLKGMNICIKPFKYSSYKNISVGPVLQRMKNVKVLDHLTLLEVIERYSPKVILIEMLSQPLYETIHMDAEIFLMDDSLNPIAPLALEKLKKRVHYSEDTDEMILMLDQFLQGFLESKRDRTFYEHYVHKENTQGNIIQVIEQLTEGNEISQ